jgi:hypothetical protein
MGSRRRPGMRRIMNRHKYSDQIQYKIDKRYEDEHPEAKNKKGLFLHAVLSCANYLHSEVYSLENLHKHIYITGGGCDDCQKLVEKQERL